MLHGHKASVIGVALVFDEVGLELWEFEGDEEHHTGDGKTCDLEVGFGDAVG